MICEHTETFEVDGLTFLMRVLRDEDMGEPWKEHDGHGEVSKWTTRDKRPGERVLASDRGSKRYYDFAAAVQIAKRDGWGIAPEKAKGLTKAQIAVAAAEADFDRMKAWCDDEWWWVGVEIKLLDVNGHIVILSADTRDSLWGIESDSPEYHKTVALEMAKIIAAEFKDKNEVCVKIRKEQA